MMMIKIQSNKHGRSEGYGFVSFRQKENVTKILRDKKLLKNMEEESENVFGKKLVFTNAIRQGHYEEEEWIQQQQ